MSLPRMSWHIGDYKKDTGHLRAAGHGAYMLLCMHYWATGGLPDDDEQLATIACMSDKEWKKYKPIMRSFFHDGWRHKRIDKELTIAQAKYEKRAEAGKKGGNAKAEAKQKPSNARANDQANGYQPITDNPIPNGSSEAKASGADAPIYTDSTHELWGEGVPILLSLGGLTDKDARSNIGRWVKETKDPQRVLGAIQRARDARVFDPVPWITRALSTKNQAAENGQTRESRKSRSENALEKLRAFGEGSPADGDLCEPSVQLLPRSGIGGES